MDDRRKGVLVAAAVVLSLLAVLGCDDRPEVVLYVSADEAVAREVVAAFEAGHDVRVRLVGDDEAKKTTGLVERLRREADAPVADVLWSSEQAQLIRLAEDGLLAPHDSEAVRARPASLREDEGRWHAFAARARVIAYAVDRVDPDAVPEAWTDLTRDRFEGRIVMADPRFGTTGGHLGAMKAWWDRHAMPRYYEAWIAGLAENRVRLLPGGNAAAVQALVDGDADLALTDTDDAWVAIDRGLPVAFVLPRHTKEPDAGGGTYLVPNTVGLVAGGPNPEAGRMLVDFLLSPAVERILAESASRNVPLHPALADAYPALAVPDPLDVSPSAVAATRDRAVAVAMAQLAAGLER